MIDETTARRANVLREEYQRVSAYLRRLDAADVPTTMRLEAREIEIVDEVRALGLPPDVLVARL